MSNKREQGIRWDVWINVNGAKSDGEIKLMEFYGMLVNKML